MIVISTNRFLYKISIPILLILFLLISACKTSGIRIDNPYDQVNWATYGQYKANLHTHTIMSGGTETPGAVIDMYKKLGYSILALTDHDTHEPAGTTWPWQAFDRDPYKIGMIAIQGNEISEVNHIGSLYNDYGNPDAQSEEEVIAEIGRRGGLAVFNHPGRYDRSAVWYADMYRRYNHLIGLEVINKNDRYPGDRKKWDDILTKLMPERPIWGMANDDMHNPEKHLGYSWNIIVAAELADSTVREAIEIGCFFYVLRPKGLEGTSVPVIKAISVNQRSGSIRIKASDYETIAWISQGNIVHKGNSFSLDAYPETEKYIRAEIYGADDAVIATQPFAIIKPNPEEQPRGGDKIHP